MPVVIALVVVLVFIIVFYKVWSFLQVYLDFFSKGSEAGMGSSECSQLWKLTKECRIKNPLSVFMFESSIDKCIIMLLETSRARGIEKTPQIQGLLGKLYSLKTKLIFEADTKKGIRSTELLEEGQKLSIIFKGKGVFKTRVLKNSGSLVVLLPSQFSKQTKKNEVLPIEEWEDKNVSVYLWRNGDAGYVFDTKVISVGDFRMEKAIFLRHTDALERAQKRTAIRGKCEIPADLYFLPKDEETIEYDRVETSDGFKCLLEDISESGSLIRVGGKTLPNLPIKIQFKLAGKTVVMFGEIRAVEYNRKLDQSRVHFECTHIDLESRNAILGHVYRISRNDEDLKKEKEVKLSVDEGRFVSLDEISDDDSKEGEEKENHTKDLVLDDGSKNKKEDTGEKEEEVKDE